MARNATDSSHLFGPVNSRRLGRSLGVDLLPYKTCSLDCVYCECGKTTCLTPERKIYVSTETVIKELTTYLKVHPDLDAVTFSGAGVPTLAANLGEIINFLKINYPKYKVCILTNGTTMTDHQVRQSMLQADIVIPSLDAASQQVFIDVDRPYQSLNVADIIAGLIKFRQEYKGMLFVEIFIVPGINDTSEELQLLRAALKKINPDGIQLNSLDRPGTESWVERVSPQRMAELKKYFSEFKTEFYLSR